MKKLLLILPLLLIGMVAFAQNDYIRSKPVGSSTSNMATFNKQTIVDANLRARLTLFVPNGTTPTLNNAKDSIGAVFFKIDPSSDTSFYVYHGNSTWVRYAKFNEIASSITDSLQYYQKLPNTGLTGNTITVTGDSVSVSLGSWRINGAIYSSGTSTLFPDIPYSPDGTQRYLTFIGTTSGTIDTLGGVADSIAVYPTVGTDQANLGSVTIGSGSIGQPVVPQPEETITGGAITSIPTVGFNPGSNITPGQWITNAYYQSQSPTFSLSGGQSLEYRSAGTTDYTLSYTAGRQTGTQPFSTIVVAGNNKTFTQPSAPGSVSGTQTVTLTNNSNQSFSGTVTTVDSKTASATTSFSYFIRRYWGRSATSTPDETIIEATAGGSSELSSAKNKSGFTISASGSNYVYYAYPTSYGVLTSIVVGGFESFDSFTRTTVSVTNSLGYTTNFYVYTSNNTFSATTPSITVN